jgi:transposase-like protein
MPWKKLLAWATGQIDEALRQKLEFVLEENRVYRALLDRHSPHWRLTDGERKTPAERGKPLGKLLGEVLTIVKPETLLKWHRQLVASKWDFSRRRKAKPGRPVVSVEIEKLYPSELPRLVSRAGLWNHGGMHTSKSGSGRRRWTSKQRQRLLARFHQSQLTLKQFATRQGVDLSTLSKWLRLERDAGTPKVKFREVRLPNPTSRWPVEVVSPQGWIVRLQNSSDVQHLPSLLRSLPC